MRRNSRSGSTSRAVRQGWQTTGPVKVFAAAGQVAQTPALVSTAANASTASSTARRSASAVRVGRTDVPTTTQELTRTMSSGARPTSGTRSGSSDPSSRPRTSEGAWDTKARDPYAQFFMQRAASGETSAAAAYYTSKQQQAPQVTYYGATATGTLPSTSGGGTSVDPGSRSLFRRQNKDTQPISSEPAGGEAWAAPSRNRPTSASTSRPGSAARGRGGQDGTQTFGEALAQDATAIMMGATGSSGKASMYTRPSSAAATAAPHHVHSRAQSAGPSGGGSSAASMALLGVGAGLAAALGLRQAKTYTQEPAPAPAPAEVKPAPAKTEYSRVPAPAPAPVRGRPPSAGGYTIPSTAYEGVGVKVDENADGDDVEAALKAANKARAASAAPAWTPPVTAPAPAASGYGYGTNPSRPSTADTRARSAAPSTTARATAKHEDSEDSADVIGDADSSDGGGALPKSGGDRPKSASRHPQATASSVTAMSSPHAGGGGGELPQPTANMTEEELRQLHREREYRQRQLLKAFVASPDFDGKSNTGFYGFGKVLGQGSFGKVRLAWHRLAGAKVAIKSYEKSKLTEPNHWRRVQQEISLMEQLNHPNLIRMLETIDSPKRIHIVMEFAGGGNLCSHVKSKRRLNEPEARQIFVQIMAGLEYMHNNGVIHRDVKLENVLFSEDGEMKLVDFGFSVLCRDPNKKLKIFCGTPSYMAPEIVMRKEYLGRPVDVWSLGVLLYACLCGCFPFVAKTYPDLYKKIAQAQVTFPEHMSTNAKDLLRKMFHPDATQRITLAAVRKHPFCAGSVPPPFRAVASEMHDKALLTSEDPRDDLYEAALKKTSDLGLRRQLVIDAILSRSRCAYACAYYLVIHRYGRKRLLAASEQLAAHGADKT